MGEGNKAMPDEVQRPQTVEELTRHLANTLVEREVMEPMNKLGWQFGTPPPPGTPDNPVPAGGAPTAATPPIPAGTTPAPGTAAPTNVAPAASEIDWESLKDPNTGLYAGKYQTPQEAARGIGHAVNMAKDALAQKSTLEKENERLRTELTNRQTQPVTTPVTAPASGRAPSATRADVDASLSNLDSVLSSIAENGGILDEDAAKKLRNTLRESIAVSGKAAVEEVLLERDAARSKDDADWANVDTYMKEKHPTSVPFADEIGLFVQTNPLISRAVNALVAQGDRVGATEFAWLEYDKARGTVQAQNTLAAAQTKEVQLGAADQVRQEAVDAARRDAGINGSTAGGVHEVSNPGPSRTEIEAAAAGMRAYGTQPGNPAAARWRELVIPLDPNVFGS